MLVPEPRTSKRITAVERTHNGLLLDSEYGIMSVTPLQPYIVRISYARSGQPSKNTNLGIIYNQACNDWDFQETSSHIVLQTSALILEISKESGLVRYLDNQRRLLLSEQDRILEVFDSYKIDTDSEAKVDIIKTPDGVKKVIKESAKIFDKKLYRTKLSLKWQDDEALFGLGQGEEGVLNLRGSTQYLHQANMKIAIPFLLSTKGYGLLMSTDSPVIFHDTAYGSYLYTEADEQMDYYFIAGDNFDSIIKGYRLLSGKAALLPKWAFGYMQSQERYETAQELIDTVKEYRKRNIGLSSIILDWQSWTGHLWGQKTLDPERFPDPEQMMKELHKLDARLLISIWPTMHEDSDNYKEFAGKQQLLPMNNIYDAFSAEARQLYWNQASSGLFSKGIDGWWCDNSEPITPEWIHIEKPEPSQMYNEYFKESSNYMPAEKCNAYGLVHAQGIYEGQRETCKDKRVINLTRSGYTGSQRYGTILWSGDTYASWDSFKKQIVAGLQFCVSGLPFWTLDIGAFFVKKGLPWFWSGEYEEGNYDLGYRELYTRWFQYGAFLPIFRAHGTDIRREVWAFGKPGEMFYDALVNAIELRYRLMPYIYSLAGSCWLDDSTMMRMLAFDFPDDKKAIEIKDQFMLGKSIMVCPVTEPMYYEAGSKPLATDEYTKRVYLPAGTDWYDFWTMQKYEGGSYVKASADISKIPLFVREGSIIPMSDNIQVYKGKDAEFILYEDSGDGYGYEQGEYSLTKIRWKENTQELTKDSVK